jgi:MIP family channel proteins
VLRVKRAAAEAIGTFGIVFAGCGAIMVAERFPGTVPPLAIPIVFGLAVAAMIYALGHLSGAHFNPAVTLAFALGRHFSPRDVPAYWLGQFGGGGIAVALLHVSLPLGGSYGAVVPAVVPGQALLWESTLTFLLMFVILAVSTDTRAEGTMAGAAIGATVALGAMVGGPVSGASMNPARFLAPAVAEGRLNATTLIYLLGPAIGAVAAAFVYKWVRE